MAQWKQTHGPNLFFLITIGLAVVVYLESDQLSSSEPWIFLPLAGVPLLPYIIGPMRVHKNQRINANPTFDRVDPDADDLPGAILAAFHEADAELDDAGFVPVAAYRTTNLMANSVAYVALYNHPRRPEVVKFIGTMVRSQVGTAVASQTVLATEFTDGTEILTSDSRVPSVYPSVEPPTHGFVFPQVESLPRLVAIHRGLVRRFETGRTRSDPIGADPLEYLHRTEQQMGERHLAWGYHRELDGGATRAPTWKGAVLMTWRMLPPWKQIRRWNRLRRAERIIRELQAEGALT